VSDAAGSPEAKSTSEMQVANIGFLIDRMGKDAHPLQFLRELTQNSIEAILSTPDRHGEVVWDVDWTSYDLTLGERAKLACIDTGIGMTGPEMVRYINQLSISTREQAHDKNFGIGAKIAALTRNHEGLLYLSWKDDVGAMIHVWRDPDTGQYGIRRQERPDGTLAEWSPIPADVKPDQIKHHGTMVVLLGNSPEQTTMDPAEGTPSPSIWIARYLNTRYFRFPEGITVRAREGWNEPDSDTKRKQQLRSVIGQAEYLEQHAQSSGSVSLSRARAHWWILKDEPALSQNSGRIASSGHMAALYQDELYEMATSRSGVARLQLFGVIFGYNRVVIYVEPLPDESNGGTLTPNAARTHLLLDEQPLPWTDWAAEFRGDRFPREIKELMEEVTAGRDASDHRQAIKDRLRQIRELFKISRYRPASRGTLSVAGDAPGGKPKETGATRTDTGVHSGGTGGRAGGVYALFVDDEGEAGEEVDSNLDPEVDWISLSDGTRTPLLLEDRAAKFLADQNRLQINADFRVFRDMIDRWESRYSTVPGAHEVVEDNVREWFEQALVETVLGAQALKNSPQWTMEDIARLWSEEALTAAVLQRYHIDMALRRALGTKLGSLKDSAVA
jgi:hypothetical protein